MKKCEITGCERTHKSRGMCGSHYEVWRRRNPEKVIKRIGIWDNLDGSRKPCQVPDCPYDIATQGMCSKHYSSFHYESTRGKTKTTKNRKKRDITGEKLDLRCTFPGCRKQEFSPGLCAGHYYQRLHTGEMYPIKEPLTCPVNGCDKPYFPKRNTNKVCSRHSHFRRTYGMSFEELFDLFSDLSCKNPGCGSTDNLNIDHDHSCCPPGKKFSNKSQRSCGKCVRGLLCRPCNKSLGMLQENPRRIQGLLDYLQR